jgi:hypothetical protein
VLRFAGWGPPLVGMFPRLVSMSVTVLSPVLLSLKSWSKCQQRASLQILAMVNKAPATISSCPPQSLIRRQLQETTRDKMLAKEKKRARRQNCPAIKEGGVVVRKRSKRSPHVQLLETVSGPLTPPTKEERSSRTLEVQEPELAETAAQTAETAFSCLDGLPWQLKLQILQHLPMVDLCRLSQVSWKH